MLTPDPVVGGIVGGAADSTLAMGHPAELARRVGRARLLSSVWAMLAQCSAHLA